MPEQTPLYNLESKAGAIFTEEASWLVPEHFGDPLAEYRLAREQAALFDVSHRGKVELTGKDAAAFLHNLSSADIKGLAPGAGCEMFLANIKAKAIAHGYVYRLVQEDRESFWLDLPPGLAEKVVKHLDHFLISEQVE